MKLNELTHAERRLYDLIKQHGRKHSSFYIPLMGVSESAFHRLKWQLSKKGFLRTKKRMWIDIENESD